MTTHLQRVDRRTVRRQAGVGTPWWSLRQIFLSGAESWERFPEYASLILFLDLGGSGVTSAYHTLQALAIFRSFVVKRGCLGYGRQRSGSYQSKGNKQNDDATQEWHTGLAFAGERGALALEREP
jgi:hypothetical protein